MPQTKNLTCRMNDRDNWLLSSTSAKDVLVKWQETVNLMGELFRSPVVSIVQKGPQGFQVVVASDTPENPYHADGTIFSNGEQRFCREVINNDRSLYIRYASTDKYWVSSPSVQKDRFNSYLGLPLYWPDGSIFGSIEVMDFAATDYHLIYQKLLDKFSGLVEADLKILDQYYIIQELSMRDHLTGLFNRSGFFTLGEQALEVVLRMNKQYTVLFIDLDNLKVINDQHGHASGDDALKKLAHILQGRLRHADVVARIGGDEFAVLMVVDNLTDLKNIIKHIEDAITLANKTCSYPFSASIGHSGICDQGNAFLEEALKLADKNMYQCKTKNHSYPPRDAI